MIQVFPEVPEEPGLVIGATSEGEEAYWRHRLGCWGRRLENTFCDSEDLGNWVLAQRLYTSRPFLLRSPCSPQQCAADARGQGMWERRVLRYLLAGQAFSLQGVLIPAVNAARGVILLERQAVGGTINQVVRQRPVHLMHGELSFIGPHVRTQILLGW